MSGLLDTVIGPFTAKVWVGLLALALIAAGTLVVIAKNRDTKLVETGREAGEAGAVVAGHRTTLGQNKEANDAGNQVRDNRGNAVFDECVRSATEGTRGNCERFRNQPVPD